MSTEDHKAIVLRGIEEIWSKGNVATVDELIAPNCIAHLDSPTNAPVPAEEQFILEGFKHFVSQWRTTFPDLQQKIELQVAQSDLVATRVTVRGTHQGEYRGLTFQGISPSGKQATWTITYIDRSADDKIVESWFNEDTMSRLQQIGALPCPGRPASHLSHPFHVSANKQASCSERKEQTNVRTSHDCTGSTSKDGGSDSDNQRVNHPSDQTARGPHQLY